MSLCSSLRSDGWSPSPEQVVVFSGMRTGGSGRPEIGCLVRGGGAPVSPFEAQIARFLAHKRALGFAYRREQAFLGEFRRLASSRQEAFLSEALARQYLSSWSDSGRPNRLTVMRALARFLVIEEPRTFIPPVRFLGVRRRRPPIHIFSRDEA